MKYIKSCPFCGGDKVGYEYSLVDSVYIICYGCLARGPEVKAGGGAVMKAAGKWNKAIRPEKEGKR